MKYYLLAILFIASISASSLSAINADNITPEEETMIARNCQNAQQTIQRIKYVDPVTRVNRGNAYSNLSKLMNALTTRSVLNGYDIPIFVTTTNDVQDLRQEFVQRYTSYESAMRDIIDFDCPNDPVGFYKALIDVRQKRFAVSETVKRIDTKMNDFGSGLVTLDKEIRARQ